jgi:hypothetical protein
MKYLGIITDKKLKFSEHMQLKTAQNYFTVYPNQPEYHGDSNKKH